MKKYKSAVIIIFLVIALPLFVWALVKLNFNQNKKAASGEPSVCIPNNKIIVVTDAYGTEGGTCHDIQAAIDAVNGDGYTIEIHYGDYNITNTIVVDSKSNLKITGLPNNNIDRTWLSFNTTNGGGWGIKVTNSSGSLQWLHAEGITPNGLLNIKNSNNFLVDHTKLVGKNSNTLDIYDSTEITISNSDISSSAGAIGVGHVSNLNIANNKIHNSNGGLGLNSNSDNVTIMGNLIHDNYETGMGIEMSNNVSISHNTIVKNGGNGIHFYGASNINLSNNLITNNTGSGIYAQSPLTGLSAINRNDIWSNTGGNYGNMTNLTGTGGNISSNPLLNSTNNIYCLNSGSPAMLLNGGVIDFMGHIGSCANVPAETPNPTIPPISTPSPAPTPRNNSVNWTTPYVSLSATNFYLNIDGNNLFISNPTINVHSDPGDDTYTSLELSWQENNVNMGMTFYFRMLNGFWNVTEVRTGDGMAQSSSPLYYNGFEGSAKGSSLYLNNFNLTSINGRGKLHFENLNLSAFMPIDLPVSQYGYALEPKPLTDQNNRIVMYYGPSGGSGYGVNVVLRDAGYNVITDQSQFYYNITTSNSSVVNGTLGKLDYSNNTCAYGIQTPCPYNHTDLIAYGLGKETITINIFMQNGTKIASTNFYIDVKPSGVITPPQTDDVFFKDSGNAITFKTIDQNPNVVVEPQKLLDNKTYQLIVEYSLQNNNKSQTATSSAIPLVLLANNKFLEDSSIPYSLIANHRDGASDIITTTYTQPANEDVKIEVVFDPNDIFKETNELNNTLTFSYIRDTPAPTQCNDSCLISSDCNSGFICYLETEVSMGNCRRPQCATDNSCGCASPSPTPKFADINNDGRVNIIDIGIAIDLYDSSSPSNPRADINGDGIVNIIDIGFIIDNYEW